MSEMTSRQRLLATLRGEPIDRIPIFPPIPWQPRVHDPNEPPHDWMCEPEFQDVIALADQCCDEFVLSTAFPDLFDRRFLEIPASHVEELPVERRDGHWTVRQYVVHAPAGDLHTTEELENGVQTCWTVEPLVEDEADVRNLLAVPFQFDPPDARPFFDQKARIGENGLLELRINTPIVCVSRLMQFDLFLEWCAAKRELILELTQTAHDRILAKLRTLAEAGVADETVLWVGGSEQCMPPMMGPGGYEDFVLPFESEIYDLWHEAGGFVHLHCHGKIAGVFDNMVRMGADCIDPIEPPPDGDLSLGDARTRAVGRSTLMGNVEFHRLKFGTPDEIEELVRKAIEEGGPDHFILYPTARAIQAISRRHSRNCIRYIEAGVRLGRQA